ncbi:HET-domain-containing protein [Xylariaceae sp. FL0016]|nr:HET-domain-containing protein [Xylariaceae sp. FL0016]
MRRHRSSITGVLQDITKWGHGLRQVLKTAEVDVQYGPKLLQLSDNHQPPYRDNSMLCKECEPWGTLRIHTLAHQSIPAEDHVHMMPWSKSRGLDQMSQNHQCMMCSATLQDLNIYRQGLPEGRTWPTDDLLGVYMEGPYYLDMEQDPEQREPDLSHKGYVVVDMFLEVEVHTLASRGNTERTILGKFNSQYRMVYSDQNEPVLQRVEPSLVRLFDIDVLKGWLKCCDRMHGNMCRQPIGSTDRLPHGFRLIDTFKGRIVQPAKLVPYVALSYMWAANAGGKDQLLKANVESLEIPGSIQRLQLPPIISDSILLCREMGERYLWTDRFCIIQDDDSTKAEQIRGMDRVYNLATFTIAAALNDRSAGGLPGFARCPRDRLSSLTSPPLSADCETRTIRKRRHIDYVINDSLWNKRGWTFQERLLSGRCLFITENQVVFECRQVEALEILTWPSRHIQQGRCVKNRLSWWSRKQGSSQFQGLYLSSGTDRQRSRAFNERSTNFTIDRDTCLDDYGTWVEDYTGRQLSYSGDILNAFAGVASALGVVFKSNMIYGLPEKRLAQCLLWNNMGVSGVHRKTLRIPSWSWASTNSRIDYRWNAGAARKRIPLEVVSTVYFHFQDPDQGLRKLDVSENWLEEDMKIREIARRLGIAEKCLSDESICVPESDDLRPVSGWGRPSERRTKRDWVNSPQNAIETLKHQDLDEGACSIAAMVPGALVFNTTVASLGISCFEPLDIPGVKSRYDLGRGPIASICSRQGEQVGILCHVESGWIEARRSETSQRKLFDFVCILGGIEPYGIRKKMNQFDDNFDKVWIVHVLLVERLPYKPFVARRVAAGQVTLVNWTKAHPRWETVVLC